MTHATTFRLLLLGCHVAAGFAAALVFPLLPGSTRLALQQIWSRGALACLGVRLRISGEAPGAGSLIVANHVSWLDVLAISAVCPTVFLCKQEIAGWPALGWLLDRAGTVFIRRASARGAWRAMRAVAQRLEGKRSVAVFPEGTTTEGDSILRFYPAMFQAAVNARALVRPVALAYRDADGRRRYDAAYVGETSFAQSLIAIAGASGLVLSLDVLPGFCASEVSRRQAAQRARELIASRIGHATVSAASCGEPILRIA